MELNLGHYISKKSKLEELPKIFGFENGQVRLVKAKLMKALFVIVRLLLGGGPKCHW